MSFGHIPSFYYHVILGIGAKCDSGELGCPATGLIYSITTFLHDRFFISITVNYFLYDSMETYEIVGISMKMILMKSLLTHNCHRK